MYMNIITYNTIHLHILHTHIHIYTYIHTCNITHHKQNTKYSGIIHVLMCVCVYACTYIHTCLHTCT